MANDSPAAILVDADGDYIGTADIPLKIDPTGDTAQPISAESLPLPVGAATETTLLAVKGKTDNIPSDPAKESGKLTTIDSTLTSIKGKTDNIPSDPAREGGNLATLAGKDFATQTTLAAIKAKTDNIPADPSREGGKLTTIDATLTAIKSTDGIKKIVDALPTGSNEIGRVAQGTKAAGSGAWPEVLYDANGNVVGVVLDGVLYRLQVDGKVAKGASDLVHLDAIDTVAGKGRMKATLYTPDGDPVTFGSLPPNPESIKNAYAVNGASDSLLVNGSVTPVVFSYDADATHDVSIQELKFVMSASGIVFGADKFGTRTVLPNGLLIEITSDGNTGTVANLIDNECFVHLASPGGFIWVVSNKDMLSSAYTIGGALKLKAGTTDKIKITVRDNLSAAATYFKCCVKGNLLETV